MIYSLYLVIMIKFPVSKSHLSKQSTRSGEILFLMQVYIKYIFTQRCCHVIDEIYEIYNGQSSRFNITTDVQCVGIIIIKLRRLWDRVIFITELLYQLDGTFIF